MTWRNVNAMLWETLLYYKTFWTELHKILNKKYISITVCLSLRYDRFCACVFVRCVCVSMHMRALSSQGNVLYVSFWGKVNSDLWKTKQVWPLQGQSSCSFTKDLWMVYPLKGKSTNKQWIVTSVSTNLADSVPWHPNLDGWCHQVIICGVGVLTLRLQIIY